MEKVKLIPDYILESSWEVCNKVGGIYTVLSTRARTLQNSFRDRVIFIGPDFWQEKESPYFKEDKSILADWREKAVAAGLKVRTGRWDIPGEPVVVLVDFRPYFDRKNEIYTWLWEHYGVDSLHAYGDYDEASMFSYAAGLVVESLCNDYIEPGQKVVYQANEWMTGLGLLYVNAKEPQVGTIFTTHATSIGRSIAGNMKPLYDYLFAYNGDQMAGELNMQSKHSIEKQSAHYADCFTTVSDITARECAELLDKPVDVVLPNGFDNSFVPSSETSFRRKRKAARRRLLEVAAALTGEKLPDDTLIVSTSGRYEFRNKGIDVFLESLARLRTDADLKRPVAAFVFVPAWVAGPREDLQQRLAQNGGTQPEGPLDRPVITHWLHNMDQDNVLGMLSRFDMHNAAGDKVKVFFVPCYLDGRDGIVNLTYYDVVLGNDLCVYPSYYEPWGYTPLEAIAFSVPCITTDLAGFGAWVNKETGHQATIEDGVDVIHRTDYNYGEVADNIRDVIAGYADMDAPHTDTIRARAKALSEKALWSEFIKYYYEAYDIALRKAAQRKP